MNLTLSNLSRFGVVTVLALTVLSLVQLPAQIGPRPGVARLCGMDKTTLAEATGIEKEITSD